MAEATITSLRYNLILRLNGDVNDSDPIRILTEELRPITLTEAKQKLYFDFKKEWIDSILSGRRSTRNPFISTEGSKIKLHQDGSKGRTTEFISNKMPQTLLSTVTAESPTAFLVRQEMRNWMMLQFEPSALRQPNFIYEVKNTEIKANGLNLPATLYRLQNDKTHKDVYQELANEMSNLISNVFEIKIDKDEKRDLLTLQVVFKDGLVLPAQSLSDGTLRFLGLSVLDADSTGSKVICLEEPENGINPKKISEMVSLLQNMATDTESAIDEDSPLRQVIINTHSPIVVTRIPEDSLYLAMSKETYSNEFEKKVIYTGFSALKNTWRTERELAETTSIGEIKAYLENTAPEYDTDEDILPESTLSKQKKGRRADQKRTVAENVDAQLKLNFDE